MRGGGDSWCWKARENIGERVVEEKVLEGERGRVVFIWSLEHYSLKPRLVTIYASVVTTFLYSVYLHVSHGSQNKQHIITRLAFVVGIAVP